MRKALTHGQHFKQHDASGKDVDAVIDAARARQRRLDLLRRHVAQLALDLGTLRQLQPVSCAGDAEVDDLDLACHRDQDVLGADVAMDDARELTRPIALGVGGLQALQHLDGEVTRHQRIGPLAAFAQPTQQSRQGMAVDVLHDDEVAAPVLVELEDLHHVWVVQQHRDAGLVDQHVDDVLIGRMLGQNPLDGDVLFKAAGPLGLGQKDLAHATGAQATHKHIAAEALLTCRLVSRLAC